MDFGSHVIEHPRLLHHYPKIESKIRTQRYLKIETATSIFLLYLAERRSFHFHRYHTENDAIYKLQSRYQILRHVRS